MPTMRDAFLDQLYDIAKEDKRVVLLSDDFGAPSLDKFRADLSGQFVHIGIAEQNMINVAGGLALAGKIVYTYAIAPFVPLRCLEQLKVNLCFKDLHITCVGVGAGFSYELSGPTHHTTEDIAIMNAMPSITVLSCSDSVMAAALAGLTYETPGPKYVRFDREAIPPIYREGDNDFLEGLTVLRESPDLTIIATGIMVNQAFKVAAELAKQGIEVGVVDFFRIKPINEKLLLQVTQQSKRIVTLEEASINGGIGSIVAGFLADNGQALPLKRLGIPDQYYHKYGDREYLRSLCSLDVPSITKTIREWL
ncbi:MAG: hypothetical protein A2Y60_02415 [Chloroflexi bacterium RBG_13_54_9]|nr:MAG: hypothetical protein A2Y60_02415 [Chloroflexi bacterium RBG_13_54_9]